MAAIHSCICLSAGHKSELTQLAEKFKQQFCQDAHIGKEVNLNDVTDVLQVSRRRLYDILGVLEACQARKAAAAAATFSSSSTMAAAFVGWGTW